MELFAEGHTFLSLDQSYAITKAAIMGMGVMQFVRQIIVGSNRDGDALCFSNRYRAGHESLGKSFEGTST